MSSDQNPSIPMVNLTQEIEELWPEISVVVNRVLRSGRFILGSEVDAFEQEAANYLGVKYAVGLNSGTDALIIGLRALGIGPGDEVITTSFSFFATAEAIVHVGATPVFVDVREDSFNIDADLIKGAVTERTKAILPVHLFGNPAAMTMIMSIARMHDLKVLEDCAQSFGAVYYGDSEGDAESPDPALVGRRTGSIGDVAAFSFYPTKNLGSYGDGGMLATDDDEIARLARMLRNHGASPDRRYENEIVGYNSRLDEIQAAVLRVKLPHVDVWNEDRRAAAYDYRSLLADVPGLHLPADANGHVYHQFTIRVPGYNRRELIASLDADGITTSIFYPKPLHQTLGRRDRHLPISERLACEVLSLPMWPGIEMRLIKRISSALQQRVMSETS